MANYNLTNKAVEDLARIWDYTFDKWSEQQADKYYEVLLEGYQDIADNPDLGRNYANVKSELWGLKINRHIIFYRKFNDKLTEITRILHERMDLKNKMTE